MRETITSTTFATPGRARSKELTTIFIPALREIIRKGRRQRIARKAFREAREVESLLDMSRPAALYLQRETRV